MAVRVKVDPIGETFKILFEDAVSGPARSRYLASFARKELSRVQAQQRATGGRTPPYETFVDGRPNAPLESVRPEGRIVFEFELLNDVFAWIGDQLLKHSPVGNAGDKRPGHAGLYRASHAFVVDGVALDPGKPLPETFTEAFFANLTPYARKIERGLSDQASDGVYQVVATLASSRFGNLAKVRFGYRTPLFGAVDEWAATTSLTGKGRSMSSRTRAEWLRRQPAIVITPR